MKKDSKSKEKPEQKPRKGKLFWIPRIITIIFIIFLSLFSLDIFGMGLGFWGAILGLFMHSLPSIILALALWIFWRKSLVLGIIWVGAGLLYIALVLPNMLKEFQAYYLAWIAQISGVAFVIAYLFFRGRKK